MYLKKDLEKILPHKNPMILIDRVVDCNLQARKLTAEVDINAEKLFFDIASNSIPVWLGIEYMAQSIGCLSGIYSQEFKKGSIELGFVIGSRNYECFVSKFENNSCLTIKVEELFFDSELGAFDCAIEIQGKLAAKAQLNVFQPSSLKDFLQKTK